MPSNAATFSDHQRDMRDAYLAGAPGMATSATAWLVAALVALLDSPQHAVWTLFVGGALIHPVSLLVLKLVGRTGAHAPGNPLAALALATTFWMIACLPLAYAAATLRIEWFFPAMLVVIGGRYLTFATVFGLRTYRVVGGALGIAAYALARWSVAPWRAALAGALIEAVFAIVLLRSSRAATAAPRAGGRAQEGAPT